MGGLTLSPAMGGILAGVLHTMLGPDHICTIVTLSACQGKDAFWFGVTWAAGHMTGMSVVGLVLIVVKAGYGSIGMEVYEHYANYAIGVLLIAAGGYFLLTSGSHLDEEWRPRRATCACHASAAGSMSGDPEVAAETHESGEQRPLVPKLKLPKGGHHQQHASLQDGAVLRSAGSALIGFVQGVACPAGIVGLAFLQRYVDHPLEMLLFIAMFFVATTVAMGTMAMTYGVLTKSCVNSSALARAIYLLSCSLSLALGIAWIGLNATGKLEMLFGHHHGHDHGADGHEHHHHEHEHHLDGGVAFSSLMELAARR